MEYKVRFIDYPKHYKKIRKEVLETVDTVLSHGDLMMRQQMRDFENNLASFVGTKYAVGTSNCTDAMHLTLRAAGVGSGDEVITVSHTFIATAAAIHHAGADPILVDISDDHNMNVNLLEAAITPRTKAIMPVNLNGRLCDMERVLTIAEKHGLMVIEDTAQSLGGSFKGKKGGNWGLAGCFSFYPAKILGAYGDAGAVVTNSEEIVEKVHALRDHGRMPNGDNFGWSFNCRLDNIHAAILDVKLKSLTESLERRREIAKIYDDGLKELSGLHLPPGPSEDGDYYDVFQNYEIEADNRDSLIDDLRKNGIEIMLPWGGVGVHQFKALGLTHFKLPRTEKLLSKALLLPMYPEMEDEQAQYVVEVINKHYRN